MSEETLARINDAIDDLAIRLEDALRVGDPEAIKIYSRALADVSLAKWSDRG